MADDILLWIPKIIDGGFVCGFGTPQKSVMDLLARFEKELNLEYLMDGEYWTIYSVNEELRKWSIKNSKREGDWNESGYFESTHPEYRELWK